MTGGMSAPLTTRSGRTCEPVECAALPLVHRVAAGVPGVIDDDQLRVGPGAGQRPCGIERSAQVETTMDQDARDTGQTSGVAQQRT